jgi:hypothetical protein
MERSGCYVAWTGKKVVIIIFNKVKMKGLPVLLKCLLLMGVVLEIASGKALLNSRLRLDKTQVTE